MLSPNFYALIASTRWQSGARSISERHEIIAYQGDFRNEFFRESFILAILLESLFRGYPGPWTRQPLFFDRSLRLRPTAISTRNPPVGTQRAHAF